MSRTKHDSSAQSHNLAARMGRWSAAHWKTATFGWLAFVLVAFALGGMSGTKMIDEKFEHRKGSTVEDGTAFGDGEMDEAVVKKALWKMDVRYVLVDFESINIVADDDV